jgi:hypothetical protein
LDLHRDRSGAAPRQGDDGLTRPVHGSVFACYGLGWLDAAGGLEPDLDRMRVLAGLMALGGTGRLATRAALGRPHRFRGLLLAVELSAPVIVEVLSRRERASR